MESTVRKLTMEGIVHSIWKGYGNYMMMPEKTVLRDTSTHRDLYVFALLRFDIVKNSICIVSFLLTLQTSLFLSIIYLVLIQNSLRQIWSTQMCYITTGVADLSWDTSISNQVWSCDGIHGILVTSGGFLGFSRFSSFEILKI